MVVTEGDGLASLVGEKRLGRVVPPGDVDAVAEALDSVLSERSDADRGERFASARWELRWSKALEPLDAYCRAPRRAPDRAENAWVALDAVRDEAPAKEQALVAEEFSSTARALSRAIGPTFKPRQRFTARYDRLCQIDVLVWFDPPLDGSTLVFTLAVADDPGHPLARVVVPAAQLRHDGWQRFEFRPLPGSRDREFEIRLELEHAPVSGINGGRSACGDVRGRARRRARATTSRSWPGT